LIDARGALGLNPAAAREGGRDATLNVLDAVDPFADDWRDAARQGVTAVYVQPGSGGNLGRAGAVLRVGPADTAQALALRAPPAPPAPPPPARAHPATPSPAAPRPLRPPPPAATGSRRPARLQQPDALCPVRTGPQPVRRRQEGRRGQAVAPRVVARIAPE